MSDEAMQWTRMSMLCLVITIVGTQQKDEKSSEVVLGSYSLWDRFLRAAGLNFYVGVGRFGGEGLQQKTGPPTVWSLHLGSASLHPFPLGTSVVEYERAYLFLSSVNRGLRVEPRDGESYLRGWCFGFGKEAGIWLLARRKGAFGVYPWSWTAMDGSAATGHGSRSVGGFPSTTAVRGVARWGSYRSILAAYGSWEMGSPSVVRWAAIPPEDST